MARQLLGNASGFIYTFIGNFDEQQIRPLIEQYIASLPSQATTDFPAKDIRTYFQGQVTNNFTQKMETPQAQTTEIWLSDKIAYTLENRVLLDAAARILTRIYDRTIREVESAAYHVGAECEIDTKGSVPVATLTVEAPTNPDKQQIARDLMLKYFKESSEKISEEDLNTVKEILLKQAQDKARENGYWIDVLTEYTAEGVDIHTDYVKMVNSLTTAQVQQMIAKMLEAGNHAEVVMMPAN
jgi:zinc protease